jgi:hypothetical protein
VTTTSPTGVLIVRAWTSSTGLCCRIVLAEDIAAGEQQTLATSGADEACAVVRAWLEDVEARGPSVTTR